MSQAVWQLGEADRSTLHDDGKRLRMAHGGVKSSTVRLGQTMARVASVRYQRDPDAGTRDGGGWYDFWVGVQFARPAKGGKL